MEFPAPLSEREARRSAELADAIRKAASRPMTALEKRAERISFIMGMVGDKSGITREMVERHVDRTSGAVHRDGDSA